MNTLKLFLKKNQVELIKIYANELNAKGAGIIAISLGAESNVLVGYYPFEMVKEKDPHLYQRVGLMGQSLGGGQATVYFKNRMVITLPMIKNPPVEELNIIYFLLTGADGKSELFQGIPQFCEVGGVTSVYYVLIGEQQNYVKDPNHWVVGQTDAGKAFKQFCEEAVEDDEVFKTFRSSHIFKEMIGMEEKWQGDEYLERVSLEAHGGALERLDSVGSPVKHIYGGRLGEGGVELSPTTLRYYYTLHEIVREIGIPTPDTTRIIEIGGGYGGLASVVTTVYPNLLYHMVEIDPVSRLARKYLERCGCDGVEVFEPGAYSNGMNGMNGMEDSARYDILISEYALSEMDSDGLDFYFETILPLCDTCYLGMNIWDQTKKDQFIERLSTLFQDIKEYPVYPETEWKRYIFVAKRVLPSDD